MSDEIRFFGWVVRHIVAFSYRFVGNCRGVKIPLFSEYVSREEFHMYYGKNKKLA